MSPEEIERKARDAAEGLATEVPELVAEPHRPVQKKPRNPEGIIPRVRKFKSHDDEACGNDFVEVEEADLLICEQCCRVQDPMGRRSLPEGVWCHNEALDTYGVVCECHRGMFPFCSQKCLQEHLAGTMPTPPPQSVLDYREYKSEANALNLFLLQAMELRERREHEEGITIEEEIKERKRKKGLRYSPPDKEGVRPEEQYDDAAMGRTTMHGVQGTRDSLDEDRKVIDKDMEARMGYGAGFGATVRSLRKWVVSFTVGDVANANDAIAGAP